MCHERGVLNVENRRNVDRIPRRAFTFIGLPLKVRTDSGRRFAPWLHAER
jgi:hypothetical protein